MEEKLLTVEQVATRLSVKIESVRRYIKWGVEDKQSNIIRLKAYKIGGQYRIHPDDLKDFLSQLSRAA